jgi:hypothetical protein
VVVVVVVVVVGVVVVLGMVFGAVVGVVVGVVGVGVVGRAIERYLIVFIRMLIYNN